MIKVKFYQLAETRVHHYKKSTLKDGSKKAAYSRIVEKPEQSMTINIDTQVTTAQNVLGTVLGELFEWVNVLQSLAVKRNQECVIDETVQIKKVGAIDLSRSIQLDIKAGSFTFDTGVMKELSHVLTLQNNNRSRRNFARKFKLLYDFATRPVTILSYNDLFSDLEVKASKELAELN